MIRIVLLVLFIIFALSLVFGGGDNKVKAAEFNTLKHCLEKIKSSSGLELKIIIDKPDKVTGYLGPTKRSFSCSMERSGTKGIYWDGWYEI